MSDLELCIGVYECDRVESTNEDLKPIRIGLVASQFELTEKISSIDLYLYYSVVVVKMLFHQIRRFPTAFREHVCCSGQEGDERSTMLTHHLKI